MGQGQSTFDTNLQPTFLGYKCSDHAVFFTSKILQKYLIQIPSWFEVYMSTRGTNSLFFPEDVCDDNNLHFKKCETNVPHKSEDINCWHKSYIDHCCNLESLLNKAESDHRNSQIMIFRYISINLKDIPEKKKEISFSEMFPNIHYLNELRHPNIVKSIECFVLPNKSLVDQYVLVTESVIPLNCFLQWDSCFDNDMLLGVYYICCALTFLHEQVHLSHNFVSVTSIYCSADGCWKLGNFELAVPFSKLSKTTFVEAASVAFSDQDIPYLCEFDETRKDSFDLYCLGMLIDSLVSAITFADDESFPLLQRVSDGCLKSVCPKNRMSAKVLCKHVVFDQTYIYIRLFLESFATKSEVELTDFFINIRSMLLSLPEELIARRLGRALLGRLVLIHPLSRVYLLPYLLRPYGPQKVDDKMLSESVFQQHFIPILALIFQVRDRAVRMALLEYFPHFSHLFDWKHRHSNLIGHILLGLDDSYDLLVSETYKAISTLISQVGYCAVFGSTKDQSRKKIFVDSQPRRLQTVSNVNSVVSELPKLKDLAVLSENYVKPDYNEPQIQQAALVKDEASEIKERKMVTDQVFEHRNDDETWDSWDDNPLTTALIIAKEDQSIVELTNTQQLLEATSEKLHDQFSTESIQIKSTKETDAVDKLFAELEPTVQPTCRHKPLQQSTEPVSTRSLPMFAVTNNLDADCDDEGGWDWDNDDFSEQS